MRPRRKLGRSISENEKVRRKAQRAEAPPSYVVLRDGVLSSALDPDPVGPASVGAQNAVLAAQPPPLLHTRSQAAHLLSCSVATLQRLEKSGVLTAIKLNRNSPAAQVYYAHEQLVGLARVS